MTMIAVDGVLEIDCSGGRPKVFTHYSEYRHFISFSLFRYETLRCTLAQHPCARQTVSLNAMEASR